MLADEASEAYAPGSLKIKYHVELTEKAATFFHDPNAYSRFLNQYIAYCLQNLSVDAPKLVEENPEGLENFNSLIDEYNALVGQSKDSPEQRRKDLAESVLESAKKLSDLTSIIKDEFKQVMLSNVQESSVHPLGVLDETFSQEIEEALFEVGVKTGKQTVIDEDFTTYDIHIYDLNTDTRKGRAIMTNPNDPKSFMKPTFKISGTEALSQTKYTESLHLDKLIEVRGRATKTDGIVKYIDIEFEP